MTYSLDPVVVIPSTNEATGAILFLHGSGDNGSDFRDTVEYLFKYNSALPHLKMIFPTAPLIPFTPLGKNMINTWYDISEFSDKAEESQQDVDRSAKALIDIVKGEQSRGIPLNRIVLAGFSRGGAMCYHLGYSYLKEVAGVAVLSSWLSQKSPTYKELSKLSNGSNLPPLFQAHGAEDSMIETKMAENTVNFFSKLRVETTFQVYPNQNHEMSSEELKDLFKFVLSVVP